MCHMVFRKFGSSLKIVHLNTIINPRPLMNNCLIAVLSCCMFSNSNVYWDSLEYAATNCKSSDIRIALSAGILQLQFLAGPSFSVPKTMVI